MSAIISDLLKYGVILSTSLIILGTVLTVVERPPSFPASVGQLVATNYGRPTLDLSGLSAGLVAGDPGIIIQLGLLILLATPVARVMASVVLFASERDRDYVLITLFVLAVLLASTFIFGPLETAEKG